MAKSNPAAELKRLVAKLQARRSQLMAEVAEIDASFAGMGVSGDVAPRRGRKPGPKPGSKRGKGGRRKRGTFAVNGEQSIIDFIKKQGTATTAEVNAHWTAEGRGGSANNTLTKLFKAKQLKRSKLKEGRGSTYAVA